MKIILDYMLILLPFQYYFQKVDNETKNDNNYENNRIHLLFGLYLIPDYNAGRKDYPFLIACDESRKEIAQLDREL